MFALIGIAVCRVVSMLNSLPTVIASYLAVRVGVYLLALGLESATAEYTTKAMDDLRPQIAEIWHECMTSFKTRIARIWTSVTSLASSIYQRALSAFGYEPVLEPLMLFA